MVARERAGVVGDASHPAAGVIAPAEGAWPPADEGRPAEHILREVLLRVREGDGGGARRILLSEGFEERVTDLHISKQVVNAVKRMVQGY